MEYFIYLKENLKMRWRGWELEEEGEREEGEREKWRVRVRAHRKKET